MEERLIAAGILHRDGAVFDVDELGGEGVYNEVDISDGSEACQILVDSLGFDEVRFLRFCRLAGMCVVGKLRFFCSLGLTLLEVKPESNSDKR